VGTAESPENPAGSFSIGVWFLCEFVFTIIVWGY
jgi:hypothetical protein